MSGQQITAKFGALMVEMVGGISPFIMLVTAHLLIERPWLTTLQNCGLLCHKDRHSGIRNGIQRPLGTKVSHVCNTAHTHLLTIGADLSC